MRVAVVYYSQSGNTEYKQDSSDNEPFVSYSKLSTETPNFAPSSRANDIYLFAISGQLRRLYFSFPMILLIPKSWNFMVLMP